MQVVQKKPHAVVAPSLLACDFGKLGAEAQRMMDSGADELHIDVMDGHFVPNISFGFADIEAVRKYVPNAFLDCHLMVTDPLAWLPTLRRIGVQNITFHIEAVDNPLDIINAIHNCGIQAGVSIKPNTIIDVRSSSYSYTLHAMLASLLLSSFAQNIENSPAIQSCDRILIMTVEPGFGGQAFMQSMVPKIQRLRSIYPDKCIEVDGGITLGDILHTVTKAGANAIVAGSCIFRSQNSTETIQSFHTTLRQYF
uniref:ribulose-phosphate 3-epimerase n=1 Tax=Lygus hesperus TaxID=30085 RepID=A0A0A9XWI8_LYGHE